MNSLERYRNTFQFKKVDRFPIMTMGAWPATILRWRDEGLPENWQETNFFQQDPMGGTGVMLGTCFWSPFIPRFEKKILEEDENHVTFFDPNGRVMKQRHGELDQSVAEYLEFPVKNREDWKKIKFRMDPLLEERYVSLAETAARNGRSADRDYPVIQVLSGPYRMLWHLFGDIELCYALYDDPELVHEVMNQWLVMNTVAVDRIMQHMDINLFAILEDMSCNTGMMISPAHFREFLMPYYKQFMQHVKRYSCYTGTYVDTDGNVNELIPLLIECGVEALTPFEVQAHMDVVKIREQYGTQLVIKGGIDKRELAKGKDAIDRELERVLPTFVKTGGYIACLDHQAPPDISLENYMYFLNRVKEYK